MAFPLIITAAVCLWIPYVPQHPIAAPLRQQALVLAL